MKITEVRLGRISVPLRTPFKTALRTVSSVEDVIVEIHTDCGRIGYGEAPPTGPITGDTTGAIIGAIEDHISKAIIGRDVDDFEDIMMAVQKSIVGNTSAKAKNIEASTKRFTWLCFFIKSSFLQIKKGAVLPTGKTTPSWNCSDDLDAGGIETSVSVSALWITRTVYHIGGYLARHSSSKTRQSFPMASCSKTERD